MRTSSLSGIPTDVVQEVSDFIDDCDGRKDELGSDETVQGWLEKAANAAPLSGLFEQAC